MGKYNKSCNKSLKTLQEPNDPQNGPNTIIKPHMWARERIK
jgi:hypothetical protein